MMNKNRLFDALSRMAKNTNNNDDIPYTSRSTSKWDTRTNHPKQQTDSACVCEYDEKKI